MDIMLQGVVLLVAGMGIVYLFLALLVYVMNGAAKIIPRFNYILPDDEPKRKSHPVTASATAEEAVIAVAVAAAAACAHPSFSSTKQSVLT